MFTNNFLYRFKDALLILIPLALITGSAFPDIICSLSGIILLMVISKKEFKFFFLNRYSIIFFSLCFYLIILSLLSANIFLSLENSLFYFRFGVFAIAIWHSVLNNNNFTKYFNYSLVAVISFVIIDSYFQFIFGFNSLGFSYDSETNLRLSGVFGEELILGGFLVRLLPILLFLFFLEKEKQKLNYKFNYYYVLLLLVLVDILIYLSGERSAFFMLIVLSVLLIACLKNLKKVRIIAIFISLFFIIIQSFIDEKTMKRMVNQTLEQTRILSSKPVIFSIQHENLYITSYKIFKDYPIFGIGPKMFREICKKDKYKTFTSLDRSINGCSSHPHNNYVQLFVETGLIGALTFIFIYFFIFSVLIKQIFFHINNQKKNLLADSKICLYISIVTYFFPLMPTGSFFNNWLSVIYYIPIGFLLSYKKID